MKTKTKVQLPDGWTKQDAKTVIHESGNARVQLKTPRLDYAYNARKFLVFVNGEWIKQYQITGSGQWIAEFNTLLEAINQAEKFLNK